jgi:hypothetical protein
MPLTGTAPILSLAIKSALLADPASGASAGNPDALEILCSTIATEVINHLIANGLVTVTVATTGSAAAQTGGGTGTIS